MARRGELTVRLIYNVTCAVLCVSAGLLLYSAVLCMHLLRKGAKLCAAVCTSLLPVLFSLAAGRMGYLLLQPDGSSALFRWCFTAGLAGLAAGTALAAGICGPGPLKLLDRMSPWLCIAMALARFSQRWMSETGVGIGLEEYPFLNRFPLAVCDDWGEPLLAVFVLESVWAAVAAVLCAFSSRKITRTPYAGNDGLTLFPGAVFSRAVFLLLLPQLVFEQLREGHFLHWRMVRLEQVLIAVLALIVSVLLCSAYAKQERRSFALVWWPPAVMLLSSVMITLLQFVMDGKLIELPAFLILSLYLLSVSAMLFAGLSAARRLGYKTDDRKRQEPVSAACSPQMRKGSQTGWRQS